MRLVSRGLGARIERPGGWRVRRAGGDLRVRVVHEVRLFEEGFAMGTFGLGEQLFAGPENTEVGEAVS